MTDNNKSNGGSKKNGSGSDGPSSEVLAQQVERAQHAVLKNKACSDTLHGQWRQSLFLLSLLLMALSLHQCQSYVGGCVRDMAALNEKVATGAEGDAAGGASSISGLEATKIAIKDAFEYIVALVMNGSLCFFLIQPPSVDFSSIYYMVANACIPIILGLHFDYFKSLVDGSNGDAADQHESRCVDEALLALGEEPTARGPVKFPIVLVFHVIVTLCCMFMNAQTRQHYQNVQAVEKLKRDLLKVEGKKRSASKSKK